MANTATGWRRLPQLGNAQHGTTARLTLPLGTYYWSVQALDTAFAGGAFAQEGSFAIAPTAPGQVTLAGPSTGRVQTTYAFTATVSPAITDSLAYRAAPASAPGRALAFPAVYRRLTGGAGEQWSRAYVQNATAVSGTLTVEFHNTDGVRVGEAYTVAVPAHGAVCLDLKEGADLPPAALAALGSDWSGAMVVTPSAGLEIVGASQTFWPGEGRAAGYTGLPVP